MKPYYQDASVKIYHADCREVLAAMKPGSVDLVLTDPPYGVRSEAWDAMTAREFAQFSMSWLCLIPNVTEEAMIFGTADGPIMELARLLFERVRPLIWHKPLGSQYAGSQEARRWFAYETIYHCYKQERWQVVEARSLALGQELRRLREAAGLSRGAVDFAIRGKKTGLCYRWEEGACIPTSEQVALLRKALPLDGSFDQLREEALAVKVTTLEKAAEKAAEKSDVLSYRTVTAGAHPCEKPQGLLADLILTTDATLILDPFMGSGTTLRAAADLGRKVVGIEIDERYCEIAAKRMEQSTLGLGL